jgi:hypothetical protein
MERLMAGRNDLEGQLNQDWTSKIDPDTLRAYIDDFMALLEEGTIAEKRTFVRGFVKRLVVKDGIVILEYTLPLASSTLSLIEGKEGVLSFEQYSGRYRTIGRTFSISFSLNINSKTNPSSTDIPLKKTQSFPLELGS